MESAVNLHRDPVQAKEKRDKNIFIYLYISMYLSDNERELMRTSECSYVMYKGPCTFNTQDTRSYQIDPADLWISYTGSRFISGATWRKDLFLLNGIFLLAVCFHCHILVVPPMP